MRLETDICAVNVQKERVDKMENRIPCIIMIVSVCILALCAAEDIRKKQVCLWLIMLFMGINLIFAYFAQMDWRMVLSGLIMGSVFMLISLCTRETIGKGDSLLIMGMGICLGFLSTLIVVFVSLLMASVYGIIGMKKHRKWSYKIPFVPFLMVSYTIVVFLQVFGKI